MKWNMISLSLLAAFIITLSGFILSVIYPQSKVSDVLMLTGLFTATLTIFLTKPFIYKIPTSPYWKFMLIGAVLLFASELVSKTELLLTRQILFVCGSLISIGSLSMYTYNEQTKSDTRSKWILFAPVTLLGFVFKFMRWPGANIIIVGSLVIIMVSAMIQFLRNKNFSFIPLLILGWVFTICMTIISFVLRLVERDYFIVGSIFIWLALIDMFLHHTKSESEEKVV